MGIGEDGVDGLGPPARDLVAHADVVFGGQRHLDLAKPLLRGIARPWPSPFDGAVAQVLAERGRRVCVLASGDPFQHGIGALLGRHVPADEMTVAPSPSAYSLAAARLAWDLARVGLVSVHGRPIENLLRHLQPGRRLLVLTSDAAGPGRIAERLTSTGFGSSRMVVLEALGGPQERIRHAVAERFALDGVHPLNVVGIEVSADDSARVLPLTPGLPDAWFEHDGQITKREHRALALAALAPRPGELLWDVGSGSGSIAIEWSLADASLRAVAVERRRDRAERIRYNANRLGACPVRVLEGTAPDALQGLPTPDAVFVGGGASDPALLGAVQAALRGGGRLVVHGVTLETEAELVRQYAGLGGELIRVDVSRAQELGSFRAWSPARPVVQWRWCKP